MALTMNKIEQLAAEIWKIDAALLPTKLRKTEIVECRNVLIMYRIEVLKITLAAATARYNRDHATACYARRSVANWAQTDKVFSAKLTRFMEASQ